MLPSARNPRVFLLDKPTGISSFAALGTLKKRIENKKVGHAGTLDPFASGLLIAMSGKLTRAMDLVAEADKEYEAVFRFGEETDTLDTEGQIVRTAEAPSDLNAILAAIEGFCGEIEQTPPRYSAVKIQGRRAYERARRGEEVAMPPRRVIVHSFEAIQWSKPDLTVRISCSKGTYIRSLARDLASSMNSCGYCRVLRRTRIGSFSVKDAAGIEDVALGDGLDAVAFFKTMGLPVVEIPAAVAKMMRFGKPVGEIEGLPLKSTAMVLYVEPDGNPAAIVNGTGEGYRYKVVFD